MAKQNYPFEHKANQKTKPGSGVVASPFTSPTTVQNAIANDPVDDEYLLWTSGKRKSSMFED